MLDHERHENLIISPRDLYYGIAALLCAALFIFMSGYFLGKKRVLEELAAQYDDESFADKVYQSFASLAEASGDDAGSSGQGDTVEGEEQIEQTIPNISSAEVSVAEQPSKQISEHASYAQLCGFGTKQAAELYINRVKRRGIALEIIERKSISKRGRTVTWYQIVTKVMDKPELEELVQKLTKDDKLTSVQIVDVTAS